MRIFLTVLLMMILMALPATAQTLTTDAPVLQKMWEIFLKIIFPTLWTAVSPLFTRGITWGLLKVMTSVPQAVQIPISSVVGSIIAGLCGAVPDFPITPETAATMGIGCGATGQVLFAAHPGKIQGEPGTLETKGKP